MSESIILPFKVVKIDEKVKAKPDFLNKNKNKDKNKENSDIDRSYVIKQVPKTQSLLDCLYHMKDLSNNIEEEN